MQHTAPRTSLFVALVLFTLGAVTSQAQTSHAQTSAERSQATQLLKEGVDLLDQRQHAAALTRFERAFALVPSAKIQFNIGLAYQGLGRPALAWRAYRAYLEGATTDAASRRQQAEKSLDTLRAQIGLLHVTSDVPKATVSVDGVTLGETPLREAIAVHPGVHQVLVEAAGENLWTKVVSVQAGSVLEVGAQLRRQPAPAPAAPPPVAASPPAALELRPAVTVEDRREPEPAAAPFYKRTWFWGVVGGLALTAAAGGYALSSGETVRRVCAVEPCVGGR